MSEKIVKRKHVNITMVLELEEQKKAIQMYSKENKLSVSNFLIDS